MKKLKRKILAVLFAVAVLVSTTKTGNAQCSPQTFCSVVYCGTIPDACENPYTGTTYDLCVTVMLCFDLCGNLWYDYSQECCVTWYA